MIRHLFNSLFSFYPRRPGPSSPPGAPRESTVNYGSYSAPATGLTNEGLLTLVEHLRNCEKRDHRRKLLNETSTTEILVSLGYTFDPRNRCYHSPTGGYVSDLAIHENWPRIRDLLIAGHTHDAIHIIEKHVTVEVESCPI